MAIIIYTLGNITQARFGVHYSSVHLGRDPQLYINDLR